MEEEQILRIKDIMLILGIGRTTLWKLINEDPDFPSKIHITGKVYGFRRADLETWLRIKEQPKGDVIEHN